MPDNPTTSTELETTDASKERVGELIHRITDDVKTIASDEVELARTELARSFKTAAAETGVILLGGFLALFGLGLLCVAAVVGLAPLISALWLRLVLMAGVYLVIGGAVAGVFARRLKRDAKPDLSRPMTEARRTVEDIKHGLAG